MAGAARRGVSRHLSEIIDSFLPRHASWASYESILLEAHRNGTANLRRLPKDDWSTPYCYTPTTESSKALFLRNLDRWYKGQLIEENAHRRFRDVQPLPRNNMRILTPEEEKKVTFKNPLFLAQFMDQTGRLLPARVLKLSRPAHRSIRIQIKKSRDLGILPSFGNPYYHFLQSTRPVTPHFSPSTSVHHALQDFKQSTLMTKALKKEVARYTSGEKGSGPISRREDKSSQQGQAAGQPSAKDSADAQLAALLYGNVDAPSHKHHPAPARPQRPAATASQAPSPSA